MSHTDQSLFAWVESCQELDDGPPGDFLLPPLTLSAVDDASFALGRGDRAEPVGNKDSLGRTVVKFMGPRKDLGTDVGSKHGVETLMFTQHLTAHLARR